MLVFELWFFSSAKSNFCQELLQLLHTSKMDEVLGAGGLTNVAAFSEKRRDGGKNTTGLINHQLCFLKWKAKGRWTSCAL